MSTTTDTKLHPLLAGRASPRDFDPEHALGDEDLRTLLEAARWAPSSYNAQPWRFVVGRRGDDTFALLEECLNPKNRDWAHRASALLLAVAQTIDPKDRDLPHAEYDLGQAVAHLTIQAEALGLATRQMAGFDADAARKAFGLADEVLPLVVVAVGRRASREDGPRVRKSLDVIAWRDADTPLDLAG